MQIRKHNQQNSIFQPIDTTVSRVSKCFSFAEVLITCSTTLVTPSQVVWSKKAEAVLVLVVIRLSSIPIAVGEDEVCRMPHPFSFQILVCSSQPNTFYYNAQIIAFIKYMSGLLCINILGFGKLTVPRIYKFMNYDCTDCN